MPLEIFDEIKPRKEERGKLRWGVLFGLVCFVVLLIAATWPTKADERFTHEGVEFILTDAPCDRIDIKTFAAWGGLNGDDVSRLRMGAVVIQESTTLVMCWYRRNSEQIVVVDETGNGGFVPRRKAPSA